jgi:hypothetical protein
MLGHLEAGASLVTLTSLWLSELQLNHVKIIFIQCLVKWKRKKKACNNWTMWIYPGNKCRSEK